MSPFTYNGSTMVTDWYGVSMPELAMMIQGVARLDRPVIDKTGNTGRFDFHLEFVRESTSSGIRTLNGIPVPDMPTSSTDEAGLSVFSALKQQLGLKLSPANARLEVIVVDSAAKPSRN